MTSLTYKRANGRGSILLVLSSTDCFGLVCLGPFFILIGFLNLLGLSMNHFFNFFYKKSKFGNMVAHLKNVFFGLSALVPKHGV